MKTVKNNLAIAKTWCGQEIQPGDTYEIQSSELLRWQNDSTVLIDIANEDLLILDSETVITDIATAINFLKDEQTKEVTVANSPTVVPTSPKNEHSIEPWGAVNGKLTVADYACEITLSNKSQDGLTFTYSCTKVPEVGAYVFQDNCTTRSWITEVDTQNSTITFDLAVLDNGQGCYRKAYFVDCLIRDYKPYMYLWGLYLKVLDSHNDDFIELDVIDLDHKFDDDTYCTAQFGVNAATAATEVIPYLGFEKLGEFDDWCKYYDESWVINMNNREVMTPDGAPGKLLVNLYLRLAYYPSPENTNTDISIYMDYIPTSKDSDWIPA